MKGSSIQKKLKKVLLVWMIMAMMIPCSALAAKPSKTTVKSAYRTYVAKNLSSSQKYPYGDYTFYDINGDGIPELFFEYLSGVRSGFKIYTYKNRKVFHMKSTVGVSRIYYSKSKKRICILTSGGAADNTYTCYKMNNGKLRKVSQYKSVSAGSIDNVKFYKNGKRISQKQYSLYADSIEKWKTIRTYG